MVMRAALCAVGIMLAAAAFGAGGASVEKLNSFRPGEIWPDTDGVHINAHGGGMIRVGNTFYWFGEHKIEGGAGNSAHVGVRCYSSRDLHNWKNEGVALAVSDDPKSDIANGCILERPKVIFNRKTGKFVMWFHLELRGQGYSAARTGVAVADRVMGPYKFVNSFRPDGEESRDMTLFVDDDQKAYLLHASEGNATLHISLLSDDYLKPAGKFVRAFEGRYMEAPAVFKHAGRYYFIGSGCTGWAPNAARSAVADSILGPWKELGNPCVGTDEECKVTFHSQSTYVLPVPGKNDAYIFIADRWKPENAIDGRYIWLPVYFEGDRLRIKWTNEWDLGWFDE